MWITKTTANIYHTNQTGPSNLSVVLFIYFLVPSASADLFVGITLLPLFRRAILPTGPSLESMLSQSFPVTTYTSLSWSVFSLF